MVQKALTYKANVQIIKSLFLLVAHVHVAVDKRHIYLGLDC